MVVEALDEVIAWHRQQLLPDAVALTSDARARLVRGDVFAMARGEAGFDPEAPGRRFDVVLLDVDHSPRNVLHPSHAPFYTAPGIRQLARFLAPGGVFALWSDDPPDDAFLRVLGEVFTTVTPHVVAFPNVHAGSESSNTVYVAS